MISFRCTFPLIDVGYVTFFSVFFWTFLFLLKYFRGPPLSQLSQVCSLLSSAQSSCLSPTFQWILKVPMVYGFDDIIFF